MKKFLASLIIMSSFTPACFSQTTMDSVDYRRPTAIGVSFTFNDFTTAQRLRTTSLGKVIANKERAKFGEMSPGLALNYFRGLTNHIDFAGTLAGAFLEMPLPDRNTNSSTLLLEADASLNIKLLTDRYIFTPYLSVGAGASKYGDQYGAFIPLGLGARVNFFNEAALFVNSQYRVPVTTETYGYHFFHSIGVAGTIGKKR